MHPIRIITITFLLLLFPLIGNAQTIQAPGEDLQVYALPVGQGDATVIQCPQQFGGGLTVVDMGSSTTKQGFMNKGNIRTWLNGQRVEMVFLTHPDKDHFNLISAIGDNISDPLPVYHTCSADKYEDISLDLAILNAEMLRVGKCVANDLNSCDHELPVCPTFELCRKEATIRILAAELNECAEQGSDNLDSMVVKLEYKGKSILILGDLEDNTPTPIHRMRSRDSPYGILLRCADVSSHVMRLAHHGAYGKANKQELLTRVNPRLVFSSSGFNRMFLHPRCDILQFFRDWKAGKPPVPNSKLKSGDRYEHRYTCGDKDLKLFRTDVISEAIFETTVCNPKSNRLGNLVLTIIIKTANGKLRYRQKTYSRYTAETFPGDSFPC